MSESIVTDSQLKIQPSLRMFFSIDYVYVSELQMLKPQTVTSQSVSTRKKKSYKSIKNLTVYCHSIFRCHQSDPMANANTKDSDGNLRRETCCHLTADEYSYASVVTATFFLRLPVTLPKSYRVGGVYVTAASQCRVPRPAVVLLIPTFTAASNCHTQTSRTPLQ